ncbi:MAG: Flp pilus assembly complex ATPase component TadA, partial [Rhodospirillaceae bacterium]|nr:Flp pilus assembly complex ATPase component TadA [Rhodospirillaceae bacterium]
MNRPGVAVNGSTPPTAAAAIAEQLRPLVIARFSGESILNQPRQALALKVGEFVGAELEKLDHGLNLLERRALISELINTLLAAETTPASPRAGVTATRPVEPSARAEAHGRSAAPSRSANPLSFETAEPQPLSFKPTDPVGAASRASVEDAKHRIQPIVVDRIDVAAAARLERDELSRQVAELVGEILREQKLRLNMREQQELVELLLHDMLGLGPLEPLLADESITDILVNGPNQVYVERGGKLYLTDVKFRNNAHVMNVASRIVSQVGRRVDESTPLCDARLQDGSRVNIIIPPLAIDGPSISIRKFSKKKITLDVMVRQRNLSEQLATVLKIAARSRLNILISGGTGSGKTTLLNAVSQMIDPGERIVTIEDAAELQLQQPHVVRLETRPANLEGEGEITMRDLVKNALRMRPDRIILGEVRGAEAVDMLQAMNTGHEGSLGTIHANRPREALTRLENMIGMAGINLPAKAVRTQIASAIDLIVQVARMRDGVRRITHVVEVVGMEGDVITTQDLFTYAYEGEDADGRLLGTFRSSGLRPHFTPK